MLFPKTSFWLALCFALVVLAQLNECSTWEDDVSEGISLHRQYLLRRGKQLVLKGARAAPEHHRDIVYWLLEEAQALLNKEERDEVGARGMIDSGMAVARLMMDAETIYTVSNLFLSAGAPQQALDGYKMVQQLMPNLASGYHQIGLTLSRMNRLEEAFEAYNVAIELLPSYAISYNNIGVLLSKMGRLEEAMSHYQAALSLDKDYTDAKNNVEAARVQLQSLQKEASVNRLEDEESLIQLMLPAQASEEMVSIALRKLISDAEARRRRTLPGVLDEDLKRQLTNSLPSVIVTTDPHALFSFGLILLELGAYRPAIRAFTRVSALRPQSAAGHHQRGLALGKAGDYEDAINAYKMAIRHDPKLAISYNNIGVLLGKIGRMDQALKFYESAVEIDPDYSDATLNIEAAHRALNQWRELVEHHQVAVNGTPDWSDPSEVPITFVGYETTGDGLGSHASRMVDYFQQDRPIKHFDCFAEVDAEEQPDLDDTITLVVVEPYRLEVPRSAREYRIYLTLFESDRIPRTWADRINRDACEVWTTLPWLREAYRASGVHVPIKILPIGTDAPPPGITPWHLAPHSPAFTFLVLANMQPRKGVVETATAFIEAFGGSNKNVRLRVHSKWVDMDQMTTMDSFKQFSNVQVTVGTLEGDEFEQLWNEADCLVSLSKGEGWGQVPREALMRGIPVIISDLPCWEDLKPHSAQHGGGEGRAYFVPIVGEEVATYGFTSEDTGNFLTPDDQLAPGIMKEVYEKYSGKPRQPPVKSDISPTWQDAANLMRAETKKGVLVFTKSLGIACGISSYTYDLFAGMTGVGFARSWSEVFVFAKMLQPRVLHIQHEHGLHWDDNEFLHSTLAFQRRHPKVVIVITHHTLMLADQGRVQFYQHLSRIAHLVCLNAEAPYHASFPLRHIEHGIPAYDPPMPTHILRLNHIATFGFWDEEKRHEQLCEVAEEAGVAIDLYSNPPGEFGEQTCDGLVSFQRAFLDTPSLLSALSEYTLLVFLRKANHLFFAVSGSARMALLANVPVICEDNNHFGDLADAVDLVKFEDIPARIKVYLNNATLRDEQVKRQQAFLAKWPQERIQRVHLDMYESLRPRPLVGGAEGWEVGEVKMGDEAKKLAEKMNTFADSGLASLDVDMQAAVVEKEAAAAAEEAEEEVEAKRGSKGAGATEKRERKDKKDIKDKKRDKKRGSSVEQPPKVVMDKVKATVDKLERQKKRGKRMDEL